MTVTVRRSGDRGVAHHDWLESRHTFSFASYVDPAQMGFRDLRVINEDRVAPGRGFGSHGHRDMEILTVVQSGALDHRDSLGNGSTIRSGDVQRMSAGTGVMHSELNHSTEEPVHFLQIWIVPERAGLEPSYEQRHFDAESRRGRLLLVASGSAREGSIRLNQDVELFATLLEPGARVAHELGSDRHAWIQVLRGAVTLAGVHLDAGDGVAVSDERHVEIEAALPAEVLLFDLR